ncbi:PQ-loop domain-containing transporter [Vagococcus silagei]|uniref:PQ-loop repeat-containing protein n=1 Tax=Vagococcus silagei TaxID=2508885 RepID=A0A4S3B059_9ENTE|nr:PQ-loop domain-containing transporter [Vagococcus silagei]THB60391.1 hypothetical protein ESZ54_10495 [Vagococcus silagei]
MVIKTILTALGMVGGVFIVYSFIPQIKLLIETKDSAGHSITFWTIISFGITFAAIAMIGMNIINGIAFSTLGLINEITQILNASLAITTLILVKKYRK